MRHAPQRMTRSSLSHLAIVLVVATQGIGCLISEDEDAEGEGPAPTPEVSCSGLDQREDLLAGQPRALAPGSRWSYELGRDLEEANRCTGQSDLVRPSVEQSQLRVRVDEAAPGSYFTTSAVLRVEAAPAEASTSLAIPLRVADPISLRMHQGGWQDWLPGPGQTELAEGEAVTLSYEALDEFDEPVAMLGRAQAPWIIRPASALEIERLEGSWPHQVRLELVEPVEAVEIRGLDGELAHTIRLKTP